MSEKTPERIALEETAKELGLSIPGNIGDVKLADRVAKAEAKAKKTPPPAAVTPAASGAAPAGERDGPPAGTDPAGAEAQSDAGEAQSMVPDAQAAATGEQAGDDEQAQELTERTEGRELEVIGPRKGRWRGGRKFGQVPTRIPLEELTDAEVEALMGDPALVVILHGDDE